MGRTPHLYFSDSFNALLVLQITFKSHFHKPSFHSHTLCVLSLSLSIPFAYSSLGFFLFQSLTPLLFSLSLQSPCSHFSLVFHLCFPSLFVVPSPLCTGTTTPVPLSLSKSRKPPPLTVSFLPSPRKSLSLITEMLTFHLVIKMKIKHL